MDITLTNNCFKENKNAYFLCHGGLGDLLNVSGALRFISYFYNNIYLFCPFSTIKNLKIVYNDILNLKFIAYDKWYSCHNTNGDWPPVTEDWYQTAIHYFPFIFTFESLSI